MKNVIQVGVRICIGFIIIAMCGAGIVASAADFIRLSAGDAWDGRESLAYGALEGGTNRVYALRRTESNTWVTVFGRDFRTAQPPICFPGCVVTVEPSGIVTKFDMNGKVVFSQLISEFKGASKFSRKWSNNRIMITETWSPSEGAPLKHAIIWVDVAGPEPIRLASMETLPQTQIHRILNDVVIVGLKDVQRLRAPVEVVDSDAEPKLK